MRKLARPAGDKFGIIIKSLNTVSGYPETVVEQLTNPDQAFVRELLKRMNSKLSYEELVESISIGCRAETDRLYYRAFERVKIQCPVWTLQDVYVDICDFTAYTLELLEKNGPFGFVALESLVFELSLRKSVHEFFAETTQEFDFSKLTEDYNSSDGLPQIRDFSGTNFNNRLVHSLPPHCRYQFEDMGRSYWEEARNANRSKIPRK